MEEENNRVSDVYIKELSQTSVRFKRDISRRMSQKPVMFRQSLDELETKLGSIQKTSLISNVNSSALSMHTATQQQQS